MRRVAPILASVFFSAACICFGQTPTATITGTVLDTSGAAVVSANITATDIDTGVEHRTVSDQTGSYILPLLPVGNYRVHVEAQGFTSLDRSGLTLVVDQRAKLDFTLKVGSVMNTVTVVANSTQLETEQHSSGTVLDEQKIAELPLNSRTFYTLAYIVPGVVPPADNSSLGFRGGFNVAGAPENANNFTLDGFDNNNEQLGIPSFRPSVDAIQEFKVLTGLYNAEYGRDAGGQVVVTGKSGTNAFHGLAYEYLRNQLFDARNYFNPLTQPDFKRNQFGGTFGGPIVRNKTFFFLSYEGLQFRQQISALTTVPVPAMLNGDFGSLLPSLHLKNPFTGAPIAGNQINTLPQWSTKASVIGRALASYYPAPTLATPPGSKPSRNYNFNEVRPESANQFGVRVDQNFSQVDSLYVEGNYFNDNSLEPMNALCGKRMLPGFGCFSGLTSMVDGISETHIFNPALVNTFRISYNRNEQTRLQQDNGVNFIGEYNIPNVFVNSPPNNGGLPQAAVTGYATLGSPPNNPQDLVNNEFQVVDQVIWTRGRHSLTLGGDVRRNQGNVLDLLTSRGTFTFTASSNTPTTGYPLADLLLGLPTATSHNPFGPKVYFRTSAFDAYFQDDWKASSRLTLNLGLRWEMDTPFTSRYNLQSTFDPALGKVAQAGTNGYGPNLIQYDWKLFEPRLGFAFSPTTKMVVRGGYGIYGNSPTSFGGIGNLYLNPPMRQPQTFNTSTANPLLLSNPFPTGFAGGTGTPSGIDLHFLTAYIQQYGLGVQRQLTANTLLDVSYFGSKGTHLPNNININQPPAQSLVTSAAGVNALRPFPAFGNITWYESEGISNYNALQAKLEERFNHGVTFLAAYTYGKSLDDTPGYNGSNASNGLPQDSHNLGAEYGPSDFDNRQRVTLSGIYRLPFGSSGRWLRTGIPAAIAGGWQFSEIFSQFSGRPFTIYYSSNVSKTLNFHDRPNIVGNVNAGPKTPNDWFNASAVVTPLPGTFGNEGRNAAVGPGYADLDATLARVFKLQEKFRIELRAEFFNVLNHPNFDLPGSTINGSGYNALATAKDPREIQLALRLSF